MIKNLIFIISLSVFQLNAQDADSTKWTIGVGYSQNFERFQDLSPKFIHTGLLNIEYANKETNAKSYSVLTGVNYLNDRLKIPMQLSISILDTKTSFERIQHPTGGDTYSSIQNLVNYQFRTHYLNLSLGFGYNILPPRTKLSIYPTFRLSPNIATSSKVMESSLERRQDGMVTESTFEIDTFLVYRSKRNQLFMLSPSLGLQIEYKLAKHFSVELEATLRYRAFSRYELYDPFVMRSLLSARRLLLIAQGRIAYRFK